jgi:hypothetical protein
LNSFFEGSALIPCSVSSSNITNFNITFTDGFDKRTKFTKIKNCTITNRNQLIATYPFANKGGNVGVRYGDVNPKGFALNRPSVQNVMSYGFQNNSADPTMINTII